MKTRLNDDQFAAWWKAIQVLDEDSILHARGDKTAMARNSFTCCVFCGASLEHNLTSRGLKTGGGAMLAWWTRTPGASIVASGLYCRRPGCLTGAEEAGQLLDVHAEQALGARAMPELERIVHDYKKWSPEALRRLVIICAELSHLARRRP